MSRFRSSNSYDDLPPVPVVAARLGSTAPTLATFITDIQQYTFDATNDFIIGAAELTHSYEEGTDIEAHVHWTSNGTDGTNRHVRFQLKYSVLKVGSAASAQVTINTGDLTIPAGTASLMTYVDSFTSLISGAGVSIGDYIVFRFERIAAAGTAPANDPFVIAVGFHMEQDSTGSIARYVK